MLQRHKSVRGLKSGFMENTLTWGSWCGTDMIRVPAIFRHTAFGNSQGKPIEKSSLACQKCIIYSLKTCYRALLEDKTVAYTDFCSDVEWSLLTFTGEAQVELTPGLNAKVDTTSR